MKSIIIRFRYEILRNETHVELHESLAPVFLKYPPAQLGIEAPYAAYKLLLDTEISALDIIRKSELTGKIEEQDHQRDQLFRGFVDAVQSNLHHFDPAKQEAARKVQVILDHYGNIAVKTFDQETAAIDDLARELGTPEHSPLIDTLGLGDWLTALNAGNERFKSLMQERYGEMAQRPTTRMKNARTAVDKAWRSLTDRIEALALVNGMTDYEAFIRDLNVVLERYKNLLAQHQGRNKKSSEE
jgi:hypothetical protein